VRRAREQHAVQRAHRHEPLAVAERELSDPSGLFDELSVARYMRIGMATIPKLSTPRQMLLGT